MKKTIFITVTALSSLFGKAQNSDSKLKVHAANIGFGGFFLDAKGNNEGGGVSFFTDVTLSLDKNLVAASYLVGSDIGILGISDFHFHEFSLLYGREWRAANWLRFEGFAGLGYYSQVSEIPEITAGDGVSFPLRVNTKFYFTKKFGMGFNTNYSINSINNNFSTNLIFHYKFN